MDDSKHGRMLTCQICHRKRKEQLCNQCRRLTPYQRREEKRNGHQTRTNAETTYSLAVDIPTE